MPKKPRKRTTPKQRDPSWKLRHALGHKAEPDPKAYTRKLKPPEEDDTKKKPGAIDKPKKPKVPEDQV